MKLYKIIMTVCALSSLINISIYADWSKDDKGWSYQKDNQTYMKSEWLKYEESWYYFDKDAYMATSWVDYQNKWYYLNQDGVMQKHIKTPDGYRIGDDGALVEQGMAIDPKDVTDIQKRVMTKTLVALVDLYAAGDTQTKVLYGEEELNKSKIQILFYLLKHIDTKELFESRKMASSDADPNLKHSAVSIEEALAILKTLYGIDMSSTELLEYIKSASNTEFFIFEKETYIAKQRAFEGNGLPNVLIDKYDVQGADVIAGGTARLVSGARYKFRAVFAINPLGKYRLSLEELSLELQ